MSISNMNGMTDQQLQTIASETNTPRGKTARDILKQREEAQTVREEKPKPKRRSRKKSDVDGE